jgi:hypothetical protein
VSLDTSGLRREVGYRGLASAAGRPVLIETRDRLIAGHCDLISTCQPDPADEQLDDLHRDGIVELICGLVGHAIWGDTVAYTSPDSRQHGAAGCAPSMGRLYPNEHAGTVPGVAGRPASGGRANRPYVPDPAVGCPARLLRA